jgi:fructose-bisphosphate aldolase, class I
MGDAGKTAGSRKTSGQVQNRMSGQERITVNEEQRNVMASGQGFIAALDQSGGSSPKALKLYGIPESSYSGDDQMFDLIHEMRARLISSPSFTSDKVLATILFEQTMDRTIDGEDSAAFLWKQKHIVPFVKVDEGLSEAKYGVQLMKPMTKLDSLLERAVGKGVFGTKMRSFIEEPNEGGITAIVEQQFELAHQIAGYGLMPIIEPEVSIKSPDKPKADGLLVSALTEKLDKLPEDSQVMLKLTLPTEDDLYAPLFEHPRVLRVVALSGGYSLEESCDILARNHGLIASFSRALTEGLTVDQSDAEFDEKLGSNIEMIYTASTTKAT